MPQRGDGCIILTPLFFFHENRFNSNDYQFYSLLALSHGCLTRTLDRASLQLTISKRNSMLANSSDFWHSFCLFETFLGGEFQA
jgi:hypothetical protein